MSFCQCARNTWDCSTCPEQSRCGPIFCSLVWFGFPQSKTSSRRFGPSPIFRSRGAALPSLFGVSDHDTFRNGLLVEIPCLAVLLLISTFSVDVTSQISRSYLELCESLDVSETTFGAKCQQASLVLATSLVASLHKHTKFVLSTVFMLLCWQRTFFEVFSFSSKFPLFWSSRVSSFEASCPSCLWNLLLDRA